MNRKISLLDCTLRMTMAFALLSAWTPAALAIGGSPFSMFLAGAYPFSLGPTHTYTNGEYGITGGFGYQEATWPIGLQFEGMTYRFGLNDHATSILGSDGYMQMTAGTADVTWMPEQFRQEPLKPRLISGVGIYNRVIHTTETRFYGGSCWDPWYGYYPCGGTEDISTNSKSETKMGLNVGGSIGYQLARGTELFVEVRYHHIFTSGKPTQFLPVNVGLRW